MKHTLFLLFFLFTSINSLNAQVFSGGTGTTEDPYQITTADQLHKVRIYPDKHFILINNIDLSDWLIANGGAEGWEPIGREATPFSGHLEGNNLSIKNLWINKPEENNIGLFGVINNATIQNLEIDIDKEKGISGKENVGGLAGKANGTILNCYSMGDIKGIIAGGLVGYNTGTIQNCYATGQVTGSLHAGALVGKNINEKLQNCY